MTQKGFKMHPFINKMAVIKIQHFEEESVVTIKYLILKEFPLKQQTDIK